MELPPLTRDQVREVDRRAIAEFGFSGLVLMENAGRGVVDALERLGIDGPVVILCGKGNNAGDGFVIARHLEIRGHACRVLLLFPSRELTSDAATNLAILQRTTVPIIEFATQRAGASPPPALLPEDLNRHGSGAAWIVDALLGTGAQGEPRPPLDVAIDWINDQPGRKLAVDLPSGFDCDIGKPANRCVCADHTCTFVAQKKGFLAPQAAKYTGQIHVLDIGVPPRLVKRVVSI